MPKSVAIHQPNFLPWIGYFQKMALVDEFILLDDVQFPRGKSYGNRVLIKANNKEHWLTVPVKSKSDLPLFNEVTIDLQGNWARKMLKTILLNYKKAAHFDYLFDDLSAVLDKNFEKLFDLNLELIQLCHQKLGLETELSLSSKLSPGPEISGDEKILNLLRKSNANSYLSGKGAGSKRYIDENVFAEMKIELQWQEIGKGYSYHQLGTEFIPNLSIIDLIFNEGPNSLEILKQL